jgi:hypothetical protein
VILPESDLAAVSQELSQDRTSLATDSPANHMPDQAAGVQEVIPMIPTMDVQIECPWCGQAVLITEAASALIGQCDACAIAVDLADPVPARAVSPHTATVVAA